MKVGHHISWCKGKFNIGEVGEGQVSGNLKCVNLTLIWMRVHVFICSSSNFECSFFYRKWNLEAQSYTVWHLRVVDFFASMFCSHRYFMIYLVKKYWLVNQSIFKKNCNRFVRYWNIRTFSKHFLSFQIIWTHSSNEPYLTGILTVQ